MAITNPNHRTTLFGYTIPNLILYIIIILLIYFFWSIYKALRNVFRNIFGGGIGSGLVDSFTGSFKKDNTSKAVTLSIFDKLKSIPSVSSQLTMDMQSKANQLFTAMDGSGTDEKAIFKIFDTITGPNQFAGLYISYGWRRLNALGGLFKVFPTAWLINMGVDYEGDLIGALKSELSKSDLDKANKGGLSIRYKLDNYLKSFNI